ncbi:MAG: DUF4982 domain-containing protein [Calditrichaeota bacterium]|nr:MAG: DUF4982 domain-containing protein [Calditrichota bacterium]
MKNYRIIIALSIVLLHSSLTSQVHSSGQMLFDDGWRFHRGGCLGAEDREFDDSGWRVVDLPHDWSIEDIPGADSPFDPSAISQVNGGFTVGGTGWYRNSFIAAQEDSSQKFQLYFEGSYMHTTVWVNGQTAGIHHYGYTSFILDITSLVRFGEKNTVAVKVINEGENSRWYSGSGLYRHVWLIKTNRIHIPQWGVTITTPDISSDAARVSINTMVKNDNPMNGEITLKTRIIDAAGAEQGMSELTLSLQPQTAVEFKQAIPLSLPKLWSCDSPYLYTVVSSIYQGENLLDRVITPFGVRSLSITADHGFQLNGNPLKLRGGCVHHDNGPLGAKAYDRAEERRVELLKASGYNAIRCAHNPPSPAFLHACDRLGMMVIDEAFDMWNEPKNPYDYHLFFEDNGLDDLASMVLRDRNHPSVIMWSIGNEIVNIEKPENVEIGRWLAAKVRQLDPTRPITQAVNRLAEDKDTIFSILDVSGYNYGLNNYLPDHQRVPQRIMMATESYPLESYEYWMAVVDHPWIIGDFVWTSFDYLGEASIGWRGYFQKSDFYPWNLAYCGDLDICGWKRPQSYYRDVLWQPDQISLFVKPPVPSFELNPLKEYWSIWNWFDVAADWNWESYEKTPAEVYVYSSCEKVELFQNGKSLGKKTTSRADRFTATWQTAFQPGTLKAVGYKAGKACATAQLTTASSPTQIKLTADRRILQANNGDLSYVTVEVLDEHGIRHPKAENLLHFSVSGAATLVAVGNANPISLESVQQPQRRAWQGRCLAILKSGKTSGLATLTVSSDGLESAQIQIEIK